MAMRTGRSCFAVGCPGIARDGRYCPEHEHLNKQAQKDYDRKRGTPVERGYDNQWRKVRIMKLRVNPLCELCYSADEQKLTSATMVHHIISIKENPNLRLMWGNLMSLCYDCHEEIEGNRFRKEK